MSTAFPNDKRSHKFYGDPLGFWTVSDGDTRLAIASDGRWFHSYAKQLTTYPSTYKRIGIGSRNGQLKLDMLLAYDLKTSDVAKHIFLSDVPDQISNWDRVYQWFSDEG